MLARKFGKRGQVFGRLFLVIQMLDELFQFQRILSLELPPQILRHEAIEIGPHHFLANVHAATFVADEITKGNSLINHLLPIINTGIRPRSQNTGDAFFVTQNGMAGSHQIMGNVNFRIRKTVLEHLFDHLAILGIAATCAIIMYRMDFVG